MPRPRTPATMWTDVYKRQLVGEATKQCYGVAAAQSADTAPVVGQDTTGLDTD